MQAYDNTVLEMGVRCYDKHRYASVRTIALNNLGALEKMIEE